MKARIIVLLLACCGVACSLNAQINIGPIKAPKLTPKEFKPGQLDKLLQSKTLFVLRPQDEENIDQIQEILNEIWTVTDIELITYEDYGEYTPDPENPMSILALEGLTTIVQMNSTTAVHAHYFLRLGMPGDLIQYSEKELKKMKKKGITPKAKYEDLTFARIELYPTGSIYQEVNSMERSFSGFSDEAIDKHLDYIWNEAVFYNWHWGYLKNALQEVNKTLTDQKVRWLFQYVVEEDALKALRNQPLYFSEDILIKYNKWNGDESERHEIDDLFSDYNYPYKVLPATELNEMILTSKEPFYYFSYVKSSTDAFYTVINSQSGEIIYSLYDAVTYNIKPKNLKALAQTIKKAK